MADNIKLTLLVFTGALLLYLAWAGRFPRLSHVLLFMVYEIEMWMIVLGFSLATSVVYLRYRDLNHVWDAVSRAGFFDVGAPEGYRDAVAAFPPRA